MHITYSETYVNVNDGNARKGQLLKNWQHSLISREVSGIAVASYSLLKCSQPNIEKHGNVGQLWRSQNKSHVKGFIKIHGEFVQLIMH